MEWQASLHLNFIDFEKAFDSVHRNTLWKLLRLYGIPQKIIGMIQALYRDFTCSVLHEGNLTPWFVVRTGVKQGCTLSPLFPEYLRLGNERNNKPSTHWDKMEVDIRIRRP